jgi:antitoxin (DNA-binding transcriptional repressor) of toxin-antitoxin stability system
MQAIGIRELRNKLSSYIRLVEAGETVLVTDRGTVVAELGPPRRTASPEPDLLRAAIEGGRVTPAAPHDPSVYERQSQAVHEGAVASLLDEERGGR